MEVRVEDIDQRLSKTQRTRFCKAVRSIYKKGDQESIMTAFKSISYPNDIESYKGYHVVENSENSITIHMMNEDPKETKRKYLKQRLHAAIREKSSGEVDPAWQMYKKLKTYVTQPLPNPDQIKENKDMFSQLASRMDPKNPVSEYFRLCTD